MAAAQHSQWTEFWLKDPGEDPWGDEWKAHLAVCMFAPTATSLTWSHATLCVMKVNSFGNTATSLFPLRSKKTEDFIKVGFRLLSYEKEVPLE